MNRYIVWRDSCRKTTERYFECRVKPKTLTELPRCRHQVPNFHHSLYVLGVYGLVELKRNVREIEPIARATDFLVVLDSPEGERE